MRHYIKQISLFAILLKMRWLCILFCLIRFSFADQTLIEITKTGIKTSGIEVFPADSIPAKPAVTNLAGRPAVLWNQLKKLESIQMSTPLTSKLICLEFDIWLSRDLKDTEFFMLSSSSMQEGKLAYKSVPTKGFPREKWVTLRVFISDLTQNNQQAFFFATNPAIKDITLLDRHERYFMPLYRLQDPEPRKRPLSDFLFFRGTGVYFSQLKLSLPQAPPNLNLDAITSSMSLSLTHPLILCILALLLIFCLLFLKKKLAVAFTFGFLLPFGLIFWIFLNVGMDSARSHLEAQLIELEKQMSQEYQNSYSLYTIEEQRMLNMVMLIRDDLIDLLNQYPPDKLATEIYQTKSKADSVSGIDHLTLIQETNRLIQKKDEMRAKFAKKYKSLLPLDEFPESRFLAGADWGFSLDLPSLYKYTNPISMLIQEFSYRFNISLRMTNGQISIDENGMHSGLSAGISWEINRLLHAYYKQIPKPVSKINNYNELPIYDNLKVLREFFAQSFTSTIFFDAYFNNPLKAVQLQGSEFISASRKESWDILQSNYDTFLMRADINPEIPMYRLSRLLQKHCENISQKNEKGFQWQYLIHSMKEMEAYPAELNGKSRLHLMTMLSRTNPDKRFYLFEHEGRYFAHYGGIFKPADNYTLGLMVEFSDLIKQVRKEQFFSFVLVLFFAFFAFGLSYFLSLSVTNPMLQLSSGLSRIQEGLLDKDLTIASSDEFSILNRWFNQMIQSLREKELISRFLSAMALNSLQASAKESKKEDATVLFCGFPLLQQPLNEISLFVDRTQKEITHLNGDIDKFTGSAVLGIFRGPDQTGKALECSKMILTFLGQDLPHWKIRIGIARGEVIIGTVGALGRMDFTCIGSTVNLAARLCSLRMQDAQKHLILVDQCTCESSEETHFASCGQIQIKGLQGKSSVFEVVL